MKIVPGHKIYPFNPPSFFRSVVDEISLAASYIEEPSTRHFRQEFHHPAVQLSKVPLVLQIIGRIEQGDTFNSRHRVYKGHPTLTLNHVIFLARDWIPFGVKQRVLSGPAQIAVHVFRDNRIPVIQENLPIRYSFDMNFRQTLARISLHEWCLH